VTSFDADLAVIGAGAVGLAIAARLAAPGRTVAVLEREARPGRGVTSRNSQVVHAGIYYPPGTLKSRLCIEGAPLLYAFCREHGVDCRPIGKLIVATDAAEAGELEGILANARAAGAGGLSLIDGAEAHRLEPNVRAVAAIRSERSGIVDAAGLVAGQEARARDGGAAIAYGHTLTAIEPLAGGYRLWAEVTGAEAFALTSRCLVNAAGLAADRVAALLGVAPDTAGYRQRYVKGNYLLLRPRPDTAVSRLIYPVPDPSHVGLGIHITIGTDGRVRLGPDTEPLPDRNEDYRVSPSLVAPFAAIVRRYLPALKDEDVAPESAGIRPKLAAPQGYPDFLIREESDRGLPGAVNLVGIESPGLTASLAIAEYVAGLLAPFL
jgi:L-2-hydroxyglutarate oxidase LhgO